MCGRVFDPEEVSQTKLNPLGGRAGDLTEQWGMSKMMDRI